MKHESLKCHHYYIRALLPPLLVLFHVGGLKVNHTALQYVQYMAFSKQVYFLFFGGKKDHSQPAVSIFSALIAI